MRKETFYKIQDVSFQMKWNFAPAYSTSRVDIFIPWTFILDFKSKISQNSLTTT